MEELPEDVRRRVVSFLPLKEAVRTTPLLSTAWRDLWRPRIVETDLDSDRIIQAICKSLDVHELLRLSGRGPHDKDPINISAARGVERELHLDFHGDGDDQRYSLRLDGSYSKLPTSSLKNLHLKSVCHAFRELPPALFSSCGMLERLKLEQCRGLECLDITGCGRLEDVSVVDCPDVVEISISAPSLESLQYRGPLPRLTLKNSPSVADVTLDVNAMKGLEENEFDCEEVLSLFASLKNVETLYISGWLLEWLCLAGVVFQQLDIRFSRLLQLRVSKRCMNRTKLDSMASFLDICPSLEKLYIDIDGEMEDVICPYFYQYWHEPYMGSDHSVLTAKSHSRLDRLRVVEVSGFEVHECGLWLLHLLLRRALLLSSMTVKFRDGFRRGVVRLPLTQVRNAGMNDRISMAVVSPSNEYYLGFAQV